MEDSLQRPLVIGLGEILWDIFPDGARFGGAPANFACSVASLGGKAVDVAMVSAVGFDDLGQQAIESLSKHEVQTSLVQRSELATGSVQVELNQQGVANYRFARNIAWDDLRWSDELAQAAKDCQIVCFGTLGQRDQRSRETIRHFVQHVNPSAIQILDVNLRPPFYDQRVIQDSLELANVLKLNEEELPIVAAAAGIDPNVDEFELVHSVQERYQFRAIALTRGSRGAIIFDGIEFSNRQVESCVVVDTVGAGDAFTAALALGLLKNAPMDVVNERACAAAAFACTQPGGTMEFPESLWLSNHDEDSQGDNHQMMPNEKKP